MQKFWSTQFYQIKDRFVWIRYNYQVCSITKLLRASLQLWILTVEFCSINLPGSPCAQGNVKKQRKRRSAFIVSLWPIYLYPMKTSLRWKRTTNIQVRRLSLFSGHWLQVTTLATKWPKLLFRWRKCEWKPDRRKSWELQRSTIKRKWKGLRKSGLDSKKGFNNKQEKESHFVVINLRNK